jgi:hypothetical protein
MEKKQQKRFAALRHGKGYGNNKDAALSFERAAPSAG